MPGWEMRSLDDLLADLSALKKEGVQTIQVHVKEDEAHLYLSANSRHGVVLAVKRYSKFNDPEEETPDVQ